MTHQQNIDIMVIIAHPDDAEFDAAGTVAKWVNNGKSAIYIVCTNGEKGTSNRNLAPDTLAKIRQKEQINAARELGVMMWYFLTCQIRVWKKHQPFAKSLLRKSDAINPIL